ncbi:GNAT family N-acetyltransferase [Nocardiopsis potens]|uniref:GNAT family N-acetyltransferase n=1 Tax=Nocardiopsis potens TaxID=1246458 RepID=UPI00034B44AD|nr:GNAT family N-acetyltransferase [Nocardiopsis potens]
MAGTGEEQGHTGEPSPPEGVEVRRAEARDLPEIVALLADDPLGAGREDASDLAPYRAAFAEIGADPNQFLAVAVRGDRVVGTLQVTFIPGLSRGAAKRAQIEAVRVHRNERGSGLGGHLMAWAEARAREAGCALVQLTSDRTRPDAHRFYERLGYTPGHIGFKKPLPTSD